MQPYDVGEKTYQARIRRTHSQSIGNSHEYTIIQQWKSAKFTKSLGINVSGNQPLRAEESHKDRLGEATIAQSNGAVAV